MEFNAEKMSTFWNLTHETIHYCWCPGIIQSAYPYNVHNDPWKFEYTIVILIIVEYGTLPFIMCDWRILGLITG